MASFTDRIPTFNPYVSQQPVESMVKVGMMKQQKYDTNLERIYQSMDEIAGLDIIHGSDQAYLKNKMNEISNRLSVYAAGDFSSNNLTRNVRGLVSSIADDDIIKTAVQSTARVRSELSKASAAEEKGKSSVVNQWALNSQIQKYLSNPAEGQSFNGVYVPYKDVDKKLMDIYDKLSDEEKVTQDIFKRDAAGNTLYYSPDGKKYTTDITQGWEPELDQVILHREIKGKSANKILKAFMASLDADDLRQLDMNGSYHYRNSTPETFIAEVKNYGEELKQSYRDNINTIAIELVTDTDLDIERKKALEMVMNSYQKDLDDGVIDEQVRNQIVNLNDTQYFEQYKKDTYKGKYLLEKANSLENISTKQLWKKNPKWQARMQVKEYDLKVKNYQLKERYQRLNYELDVKEFGLKEKIHDKNVADAAALANPSLIVNVPLVTDQEKTTFSALSDELDGYTATPDDPRTLSDGTVITEGTLYSLNKKFAESTINITAPGETKEIALEELFLKIRSSPSDMDEIIKNNSANSTINSLEFYDYYKKRLHIENQKTIISKRYHDAFREGEQFDNELNAYIGEETSISIGSRGGERLTRKEINEFNIDKKNYTKEIVEPGYTEVGPDGPIYYPELTYTVTDFDSLRKKYNEQSKYLKLIDIIENGPRDNNFESTVFSQYKRVTDELLAKKVDVGNRKKEHQDRYVAQHTPRQYAQLTTLLSTIKEQAPFFNSVRQQVLNAIGIAKIYGEDGDTVIEAMNKELSADDIADIRRNINSGKFPLTIIKNRDGGATVTVTGETKEFTVNLTPEQVRDIPKLAIENPFNQALEIIKSSKNHSTNTYTGGKSLPAYAYYSGSNFPLLVNSPISLRVRADIMGSNSNVYSKDPWTEDSFTNLNNTFALVVYYDLGGGNWMSFETNKKYMPLAYVYSDMKRLDTDMINHELKEYHKLNK